MADFLADDYCCEMIYATLVAWDMNSRGARMKDFDAFRVSLRNALPELKAVEAAVKKFNPSPDGRTATLDALVAAYRKLELMVTGGRLVSNSKCLHFMFPEVCLPMDGRNTLTFFYGNTHESANKFRAVLDFARDALLQAGDLSRHLDDEWNSTPMKMVDNVIILLATERRRAQRAGQ